MSKGRMKVALHKQPLMKLAMDQLPMPQWVRESPKIQQWVKILGHKIPGEGHGDRKERLKEELQKMDFDWRPRRGDGSDAYGPPAAAEEEEIPF